MILKLNIHNRLALVLWGAALLAFVVGGAGLLLYQSFTLEHRARQIMEPYAQLLAVGTDTAVAFEDPVRAQEILDTLRANPQILEAEIYLDDGRILARFSRIPNVKPGAMPGRPDGIYLGRDTAELLQGLPRGARLRLSMGLDQLSQQTHQALWIFGIGVLVLLIGTLAQLAVLRRMIVRPIASLMEATELVRAGADYRHRVPASGTDEVARLGQNFNAMMEAIQERENDLHRLTLFQRTILDNVAYGIISTTPEGMVTSFNSAAERLLGYTADEVVGKQTPACWHDPEEIARYARQLSEELGETIPPGFEVFAARPRRKLSEENEWTFVCKDGKRIPVNLSVTALWDDKAQITGFVGLGHDLTERKQAEEARQESEAFLNSLLDAIPIPVFYKDKTGRYLGFNRAYETFFGATKDSLIGKTAFDISPRELAETYYAKDKELFEGEGAQQYESQVKNSLGVVRDVIFSKAVFTDRQGAIIGLIGAILDITERKLAEEEVRKLNQELELRVADRTEQLESAIDELEAFSYSVSHDLRTPLRAIDGFSKILLDGYTDKLEDEGKRLLNVVRDNTRRMGQLIDDMLKFSRTGRVEISFSEIDMEKLACDIFDELKPAVADNKLQVEIEHLPSVRGDRAMMRQVFVNLLANAIKFSRHNETPRIHVGASVKDNETIYYVQDNGAGFDMQFANKLFGVFQRLHSSTEFEGTGIGLAIVKRIITRHGGRVWAEGKINEGATFYFALPTQGEKS